MRRARQPRQQQRRGPEARRRVRRHDADHAVGHARRARVRRGHGDRRARVLGEGADGRAAPADQRAAERGGHEQAELQGLEQELLLLRLLLERLRLLLLELEELLLLEGEGVELVRGGARRRRRRRRLLLQSVCCCRSSWARAGGSQRGLGLRHGKKRRGKREPGERRRKRQVEEEEETKRTENSSALTLSAASFCSTRCSAVSTDSIEPAISSTRSCVPGKYSRALDSCSRAPLAACRAPIAPPARPITAPAALLDTRSLAMTRNEARWLWCWPWLWGGCRGGGGGGGGGRCCP